MFLKGCPLHCIWCHNPESNSIHQELFYDNKKCTLCGKCAENCMPNALESVGYRQKVSDIIKEILKDQVFYETSGGGMTISGGEPMYQAKFTYELLKAAKEQGIHTCIETCGYANEDNYKNIANFVDIFLFDYKETDPQKHREFTGVSNDLILQNLRMLDNVGTKIILRCPIIPTRMTRCRNGLTLYRPRQR